MSYHSAECTIHYIQNYCKIRIIYIFGKYNASLFAFMLQQYSASTMVLLAHMVLVLVGIKAYPMDHMALVL